MQNLISMKTVLTPILTLPALLLLGGCASDSQTEPEQTVQTFSANQEASVQIVDNFVDGQGPANNPSPETPPAPSTTTPTDAEQSTPNPTPNFTVQTPPIPGCLLASNSAGIRFCYEQDTRTLGAYRRNNSVWWSFQLPGNDTSNKVEQLVTTDDELIIVANLDESSDTHLDFELSKFEFEGAFIATTEPQTIQFGSAVVDPNMSAIAIDTAIYLVSHCEIGVNDEAGTYIARIFIETGQSNHSECIAGMILTGEPSGDAQNNLVLTVNGAPTTFDRISLNPLSGADVLPYSMERRVAIRDELLQVIGSSANEASNDNLSWIGSFSRTNVASGNSESVDANLTGNQNEDGITQLAGSLHAIRTGTQTQSFTISAFDNNASLVRYEIESDGVRTSLTETW